MVIGGRVNVPPGLRFTATLARPQAWPWALHAGADAGLRDPLRPLANRPAAPGACAVRHHRVEAAVAAGGRFLLRIEDIDATRRRPEFEQAIHEDLHWLGLEWETPVRRQSEHLGDYQDALVRLRDAGLLYRDFRTRTQRLRNMAQAPHGPVEPDVAHPATPEEEARLMAQGTPFAWRLSLQRARAWLGGFERLDFIEEGYGPDGDHGRIAARPETAGDVVLARKDVGVAYHLAVVVDDALQGVTHVVRGEDLFEATHIQRLLQALLELPTPAYRHHRLVLGPDGKRLAKRNGGATLRSSREQGASPEQVRAWLFDSS